MMMMKAVFMVVVVMMMRPPVDVRVTRRMYVGIHFRLRMYAVDMRLVYRRLVRVDVLCLRVRLFARFGREDAVEAEVYEAHGGQAAHQTAYEHSCYSAFLATTDQVTCRDWRCWYWRHVRGGRGLASAGFLPFFVF